MKRNILFIPASIHSHIMPSLYLADLVRDDYNVYYLVTDNSCRDLVESNGFPAIQISALKIAANMEHIFIQQYFGTMSKFSLLKSIIRNDIYHLRRKEFLGLINRIKPDVIVLDIFCNTDMFALASEFKDIRYVFFSPMLNTRARDDLSIPIREGVFGNLQGNWWKKLSRFGSMRSVIKIANRYQLGTLIRESGISEEHIVINKFGRYLFTHLPELILAPSELEIPTETGSKDQHYVGLCIQDGRKDRDPDPEFANAFEEIVRKKGVDIKLLYCSFGTFEKGSDRWIISFLTRLREALEDFPNVYAIVAANSIVKEVMEEMHKRTDTFRIFSYVPQKEVLAHADLFVTHGGLGSIKESIHSAVPMLVYPLDPMYDQIANGQKVEFHKLGLAGELKSEGVLEMRRKLGELLQSDMYRRSVLKFRNSIREAYQREDVIVRIKQILDPHETRERQGKPSYSS